MTPKFTCSLCGKTHPCPWVVQGSAPPEERKRLREEMLKAEALLEANWGVESYARKHAKTEMAYYSSYGNVEGWGFPDTATTSRGADGWYTHCK